MTFKNLVTHLKNLPRHSCVENHLLLYLLLLSYMSIRFLTRINQSLWLAPPRLYEWHLLRPQIPSHSSHPNKKGSICRMICYWKNDFKNQITKAYENVLRQVSLAIHGGCVPEKLRSANTKSVLLGLNCYIFLVLSGFPLFSGPRIFKTANTN